MGEDPVAESVYMSNGLEGKSTAVDGPSEPFQHSAPLMSCEPF
jgi:hypothetical protein